MPGQRAAKSHNCRRGLLKATLLVGDDDNELSLELPSTVHRKLFVCFEHK